MIPPIGQIVWRTLAGKEISDWVCMIRLPRACQKSDLHKKQNRQPGCCDEQGSLVWGITRDRYDRTDIWRERVMDLKLLDSEDESQFDRPTLERVQPL